jgi:hypothetical protein
MIAHDTPQPGAKGIAPFSSKRKLEAVEPAWSKQDPVTVLNQVLDIGRIPAGKPMRSKAAADVPGDLFATPGADDVQPATASE